MRYKITDETLKMGDLTLYRIEATEDFSVGDYIVIPGDKGGWIEKESNLQENAWVSGEAIVCDDAVVTGNAYVCDHARICDSVTVDGNAFIGGVSTVSDDVVILHKAQVLNTHLHDQAHVVDKAVVSDGAELYDNVTVCDEFAVLNCSIMSLAMLILTQI